MPTKKEGSDEQTKKCSSCHELINKKAKKCKHCGADLRNWPSRHPIWTGIIILITVPWVVSLATGSTSSNSSKTNNTIKNIIGDPVEIVDVSTKVTEKNNVWWKYAWQATLKNNSSNSKTITLEVKWLDAEKFIVDTDTAYSLTVGPNQEQTFNDFQLITYPVAQNVVSVIAEIK